METHNLDSWGEFRPLIQRIGNKWGKLRLDDGQIQKKLVLFRGQSNSIWPLSTTLERRTEHEVSVEDYIVDAALCSHELESTTGRRWDLPRGQELADEIRQNEHMLQPYFTCYEYLVYLRHHGFPSPFLDWTRLPYIAAYFAFFEESRAERVAVYSYIELIGESKRSMGMLPRITSFGPHVTTHKRHFAQKAWYTVATRWKHEAERPRHVFCAHSEIFDRESEDQDMLIKITIPSDDRLLALRELDDYNINHFTLFQTEDALVTTLALREFDLGSR